MIKLLLVILFTSSSVFAQTATTSQVSTEVDSSSFTESIKINGDLRYRHEWIEVDSTRTRQRIRARVGAKASPAHNVDVGFQLATGASDPVSSNESLDSGFSKKSIGIDMAYIDYYPVRQAHLVFGKQKNPFAHFSKSELIWDGDLRPEGVSVHADSVVGDVTLDANAGMFWVEERSSAPDTYLVGAQ